MKTGYFIHYCDNCNAEFPSITHLNRHKKTAKHIKIESLDKPKTCIHCNKSFTEEGYKIHCERNELYWKHKNEDRYKFITDECSCNNYLFFEKRYATYKELVPLANEYIRKWRFKCETYSDYSSCSEEEEQNICMKIT